jgi:hypothetical protein
MLDTPFDTDTEEGTPERQLLPAGRYKAEITKATYGPTKNGKGHKIDLTAVVVGGEHDKRVQFASILMQHESEDAQRFGRQKFKDLCVACGVGGQVTDLDTLLYKPIVISVNIRKDKNGEYPDKNEITRFMPVIANWNGQRPTANVIKITEAPATPKVSNGGGKPMDDEIPF